MDRKSRRILSKRVADNLAKSERWLVLRYEDGMIHLDTTELENTILFSLFFDANPEIYDAVRSSMETDSFVFQNDSHNT